MCVDEYACVESRPGTTRKIAQRRVRFESVLFASMHLSTTLSILRGNKSNDNYSNKGDNSKKTTSQ